MTNVQAGYVGSMLCVGGSLGSLFYSWLAEKIGRKRCLLLTAIPSLLAWGIIPIARNPIDLCISRFFGGLVGGGVLSVIPLYVTEISETRVRGELGALVILTCNLGTLLAFILGNFFSYATVALMLSSLTLLFLILFSFLPESPQYLIRQNRMEEAEKAMRFLRNAGGIISESSKDLRDELEQMQAQENPSNIEKYSYSINWSDINNRIARKALMIGVALLLINQLCGCFAMISYTATIFQQSGSSLSPNMSAVVVGIIQVVGSYASTLLVERAGRKVLLVTSAFGTGFGLTCLGGYTYLTALGYNTKSFNWVPVISFSISIFIANVGILTLPYMVVCEILPPKIRNVGSLFCMSLLWILSFFMLLYFPILSEILGIHSLIFIFAANCFAGAYFIIKFLPETKGMSIERILSML